LRAGFGGISESGFAFGFDVASEAAFDRPDGSEDDEAEEEIEAGGEESAEPSSSGSDAAFPLSRSPAATIARTAGSSERPNVHSWLKPRATMAATSRRLTGHREDG
jgi:hypothetical protein